MDFICFCCSQIFEASTESDVLLPSYVIFDGTTGPISTLRLASFTGTRFFRSIFAQLQASPRQSAPHHRPSHHQRSLRSSARAHAGRPDACRACFRVSDWGNRVRLDAVSADTLDLLLRLMEGKAPARVTLRQACELFGALDYCLAQNLAAAVVYYLGPLIMALTPKEVCTFSMAHPPAACRRRCAFEAGSRGPMAKPARCCGRVCAAASTRVLHACVTCVTAQV